MFFRAKGWTAIAVATIAVFATRRAAAQKAEPQTAEHGAVADVAAPASVLAGEGGFELRSAGEAPAYRVRLGALIQADSRVYFDDQTKDNILLRRARPILTGTVLGFLDFNLTTDFGGGQPSLVD